MASRRLGKLGVVRTLTAAVLMMVVGGRASAQPAPMVAVGDISSDHPGWAPPAFLSGTIAELLADQLAASGQYRVVDRAWLVAPAESGRRLPLGVLRERAAQAGIDYLVTGAIVRYSTEGRRRSVGGGLIPFLGLFRRTRTETRVGLTVHVIDVHSGEWAASATADGVGTRRTLTIGGLGVSQRLTGLGGVASEVIGAREVVSDEAVAQAVARVGREIIAQAPHLMRPQPAAERPPSTSTESAWHARTNTDTAPE